MHLDGTCLLSWHHAKYRLCASALWPQELHGNVIKQGMAAAICIVTKVEKLTVIILSWICIFPDELAQRACWLSSLAIKVGNWSFLSFHTDEARRAAMSFHHGANSSQIYLSVSFQQKALASCHFICFSLFVSFHSFTDRKKKKNQGFILSSKEDLYFCLFWIGGTGMLVSGWFLLTSLGMLRLL